MTRRALAELAIRLIAVIVVLFSLWEFVTRVPLLLEGSSGTVLTHLVATVVGVGLGVITWIASDRLGAWMVREDGALSPSGRVDPTGIREIAFSILGVYLIVRAIPQLVSSAIYGLFPNQRYFPLQEQFRVEGPQWGSLLLDISGPVTSIIVGVVLTVGARRIALWIGEARARARSYDIDDTEALDK